MTLIRFAPLSRPAAFLDGTETLLAPLAALTEGWEAAAVPSAPSPPLFTVRRQRLDYRVDAPWLDKPVVRREALRIAGNIAVDLTEAYQAENPSLLSIHGAAVLFAGRLVIFPAPAETGKSTLCARLAAAGFTIFCDDVLMLEGAEDDQGLSLGIAPRLRLPLPSGASRVFRRFLDDHQGPRSANYLYLRLPEAIRPEFGRRAPIGAIVLLERGGKATAIEPASGGDGLEALVLQSLSEGTAATGALVRLEALVARMPCFRMVYSDLDDACAALHERFGDWEEIATPEPAVRPVGNATGNRPSALKVEEPRFLRRPDASVHGADDGLFLAAKADDAIYRLNALSLGIWNLLAEPTGTAEAAAILGGAFPEVDKTVIERDIDGFFADLLERGLIVPA